jgi:hypothetical protein
LEPPAALETQRHRGKAKARKAQRHFWTGLTRLTGFLKRKCLNRIASSSNRVFNPVNPANPVNPVEEVFALF